MRRTLLITIALAGCATTSEVVPESWMRVPEARRIRTLSVAADGTVSTMVAAEPAREFRVEKTQIVRGEQVLAGPFTAIDSADYSESRKEIVFSARKDASFDIGLVALEGSDISWVPAERLDEIGVQWAPSGNKISYIVRAPAGDLVRTVHIPTAFQLTVDFPYAHIDALAWDPPAEKFAVAYSTPDASARVEVMRYRGAERKMAVPPSSQLDAEVEPLAAGAVLLRRRDLQYNERLPVVVWVDDNPLAWSDARAALFNEARIALVVTAAALDDKAWQALRERPWIDAGRAFIVGPSGTNARGATLISADTSLPAGRYRQRGSVVTVAPAVVQSFAARFIAGRLKRTDPPNGNSR